MTRLKLEIPESFEFTTVLDVRITDLNYGGHLGNDSVLSMIHEARVRYLKNYDLSEKDFAGVSLIMADAQIQFRGEAFYADKIEIAVTARNINKIGFDIYYLLRNSKTGKEAARAKTSMVCFDYEARETVAVPGKVVEMWKEIDSKS